MKILCVEDGSVNEETLQQFLENPESCNGKVLIYRQGAKPPYMLDFGDSQDRVKQYCHTRIRKLIKVYGR